ncbi:MAG: hypothetical protein WCX61_03245 [Candidatus Peribacteraceae bacterium]|jgi:hypothetical protein
MLTFTLLGGSAIHCVNGSKALLVFPPKPGSDKEITLLAHPEEAPSEGVISWPGEYDFSGVAIRGIGHGEGAAVSYAVEIEGVRCAFFAAPLHDWTDYELELLGDIDVLFIPADDVKLAQKLIDQIDPRVLCPLLSKDAQIFEEVLKVCGAQDKESVDEYKVKGRGSLPVEGRDVVILKAQKG